MASEASLGVACGAAEGRHVVERYCLVPCTCYKAHAMSVWRSLREWSCVIYFLEGSTSLFLLR